MERVNLTSFGFRRSSNEDFCDDGSKFFVYRIGKLIRVSKLVRDGYAYISARAEDGDGIKLLVDYNTYSKLPHYQNMDKYNGCYVSSLTEQNLIDFANDCLAYEKEVMQAQLKVLTTMPTYWDLTKQCNAINAARLKEYNELANKISSLGLKIWTTLSRYDLSELQEKFKHVLWATLPENQASPDKYCDQNKNVIPTRKVLDFMKIDPNNIPPDYWYTRAMEYIYQVEHA